MTIFPPDPDLDALRLELSRLRAARGWTYDELAARTGLARRTLIELEQGRTTGTLTTWHAVAHALNAPLDRLFSNLCNGHEPPTPPASRRNKRRRRHLPAGDRRHSKRRPAANT